MFWISKHNFFPNASVTRNSSLHELNSLLLSAGNVDKSDTQDFVKKFQIEI